MTPSISSRTRRPRTSERLEVRLRPQLLQAAAGRKVPGPASVWKCDHGRDFFKQKAGRHVQGLASVWKYGCGLDFFLAAGGRGVQRPSECLERPLRPRPFQTEPDERANVKKNASTASSSSSSSTRRAKAKQEVRLRRLDERAKAQRASGRSATAATSSSSSRTTSSRPGRRIRSRLLQAAAGREVQGPAGVWQYH